MKTVTRVSLEGLPHEVKNEIIWLRSDCAALRVTAREAQEREARARAGLPLFPDPIPAPNKSGFWWQRPKGSPMYTMILITRRNMQEWQSPEQEWEWVPALQPPPLTKEDQHLVNGAMRFDRVPAVEELETNLVPRVEWNGRENGRTLPEDDALELAQRCDDAEENLILARKESERLKVAIRRVCDHLTKLTEYFPRACHQDWVMFMEAHFNEMIKNLKKGGQP